MWIIPLVFGTFLAGGMLIGVTLGLVGMVTLYLGGGTAALQPAIIATWNILYNYPLAALPMYIFLGEIFVTSGLASRSYKAITPLFERFPGRLLVSNVMLCTMLGAILGSSQATAAIVGSIAYRELSERGYQRTALVGNLAGSGTLGSFVPPCIGLILYGAWVEISVGACFAAILIPALITATLFMIYLMVICSRRHDIAPSSGERVPLKHAIVATKGVWPMLILMICIMGTIYFGIATAVEAAGLAVVIALIMSVAFRTFNFKQLHQSLTSTIRISGMLLFIVAGATIFAASLSLLGLPRQVVLAVGASGLPTTAILAFVVVLYLVLGCFLPFVPMLLMTLPVTFPLMMNMGFNPYWFGALLTVTGEMGLLTPPVGMNLYILQGVTHGEVSIGEVAKGSVPYFFILGVTLILILVFPQLATWLPARMF